METTITKEQIKQWKSKAEKWDALEAKIEKFYIDENGEPIEDDEVGDWDDDRDADL